MKEEEESNDGSQTFMDILPWEDVIFRYLFPRLSLPTLFQLRACSRQMKECTETYFTCCKSVDVSHISTKITVSAFILATHNNCVLRTLVLRNAKNWLVDAVLVPVFDIATYLVTVDLTGCTTLSNASLEKLAVCCPQIEHLSLGECHWLSKEGLLVLAMNSHQLRTLDLTACWQVDDESIMVIASFCKQ